MNKHSEKAWRDCVLVTLRLSARGTGCQATLATYNVTCAEYYGITTEVPEREMLDYADAAHKGGDGA